MDAIEKRSAEKAKSAFMLIFLFVILLNSAFAQNEFIINFGTEPSGYCTYNSQCTSNLCVDNQCVSCTADSNCSSNLCESGVCTSCTSDGQCSRTTNFCLNGFCTACGTNSACSTGLCLNGVCTSCTTDEQCAETGYSCISGKCRACTSDAECTVGLCQAGGFCKSCTEIGCPNSWTCSADTGKCTCKNQGQTCVSSEECCTGACRAGVCALCVIDSECLEGEKCSNGVCISNDNGVGEGEVPSIPSTRRGGRGSSSSSYQQAVTIVREENRTAAASFIYSIFGVSKTKIEASATCIRGALCATSADCCGAECINGACLCAKGACVTSGECCTGYCENGMCKNPPAMSLFLAEALNKPITSQFACAGLIEECDPSENQCVSICNGLTGILALVSIGFGGYIWREFKHPVPGLVGAFVPVMIGLVTYPFVGIIVGVIMLGLLLAK